MKNVLFLLAIAACTTSGDPSFLDHAQILAVRAEPAHVEVGGTVRVDMLAGDDAGEVTTSVPDTLDAGGLAAMRGADGWYVIGPAGMPAAPTITVTATIDGRTLVATKTLVFGDDAENPTLAAMEVDGQGAAAIDVPKGDKPPLDVGAAGAEPLAYAWYTSVGKLEHYRTAEPTFDADAAGDGIVCVVVRDAQGGVAWQILPAHVE
jgi:hypothetical protein